ncbi:MAG: RNA polymerase sigma factor [Propioniciclava sp.]
MHGASEDDLAAARGGDSRAFERLVSPYRDRLWAVCLRTTRHPADAEDALQECLIALWRNLDKYRGDATFSTWAYRIATNAALGVIRRRRDESEDGFEDRAAEGDFAHDIAERDRVQAALRQIPEDFRVALVLREYGQLTYDEIAAHQGILVQTVKSRISRARAAMAAVLTEME